MRERRMQKRWTIECRRTDFKEGMASNLHILPFLDTDPMCVDETMTSS